MPRITTLAQQHRHSIGDHTAREDAKRRTQVAQDEFTRKLADRPGLNRGNVQQQQNAATLLQLFSYLTTARNTPSTMVDPPFLSRPQQDVSVDPSVGNSTQSARGATSTAVGSFHSVLMKVGEFMDRNDPLKFPQADATAVGDRYTSTGQALLNRQRRGFAPEAPTKSTTEATDDVVKVKIDFSCINKEESWTFARILREVGQTLSRPVSTAATDIHGIISWLKSGRCLSQEKQQSLDKITSVIDAVVSQVLTFLPGSTPLAVAQFIVGPLLEQAAADIEGRVVSTEERVSLITQIVLMSRIDVSQRSKAAKELLSQKGSAKYARAFRPAIPRCHLNKGRVEIAVVDGKKNIQAPVVYKEGKVLVEVGGTEGNPKTQEVFYNHVHQEWQLTGNGKFNRFSRQERAVAYRYGVDSDVVGKSTEPGKRYYGINNPYVPGEHMAAIEVHGRFVAFSEDVKTGRTYIHNAANLDDPLHEVVFTQNEWHLKAPSAKLKKIVRFYSPDDGLMLDVAVVRTKKGKPIYAQMDRQAGFFFGPKYKLNGKGELQKIKAQSAPLGESGTAKKRMGKGGESSAHRHESAAHPGGEQVVETPGLRFGSQIIKREMKESPFVQFYAKTGPKSEGSEILTVSAHGGYFDGDETLPPVDIPVGVKVKMAAPHNTALLDNGLPSVVNQDKGFRPFVTLMSHKGKTVVTDVDFIPQDNVQEAWREDTAYDPNDKANTLGRPDGLQDYRLTNYGDTDEEIAEALIDNWNRAAQDKVPLSDVLTIHPTLQNPNRSPKLGATTQRILDLDRAGKLLNAKGERYKDIVFAHCRVELSTDEDFIRDYDMRPPARPNNEQGKRRMGGSSGEVTITRLHRRHVDKPFEIKTTRYELFPKSTSSSGQTASTHSAI